MKHLLPPPLAFALAFALGFGAAMLADTVVDAFHWLRGEGAKEPRWVQAAVSVAALVLAAAPIGALIFLMLRG